MSKEKIGWGKIILRIKANLAIKWWEEVFGEDFFDDFPEVQIKISERLKKILK